MAASVADVAAFDVESVGRRADVPGVVLSGKSACELLLVRWRTTHITPVHAGIPAASKSVAPALLNGPVPAKLAQPAQDPANLVRVAGSDLALGTAHSLAVVLERCIGVGGLDDPPRVQAENLVPEVLDLD